jgi:hypothetical protein
MYRNLYQDLAPPMHGQVAKLTHSATAVRREVPPQWRHAAQQNPQGAIIMISSTGSDLDIAFGDAGVMIAAAERSVVVGETLALNMASGFTIPAGSMLPVPLGPDCTHMSFVSSGTDGTLSAYLASGSPGITGESLDIQDFRQPILWLDFATHKSLLLATADIATAKCREHNYEFTEATNRPALVDAATVAADLIRPAASFTAGNSDKLVCTSAQLASKFGGVNPFTLMIAARRGAATAVHTLFSVGTAGSDNGRWDFSLNASEDPIMTRVDSAGNSTTSSVAATIASGDMNVYVWTFDGATPLFWQDRVAQTLTGTAAGDVGTTTKVALGCRAYNTSTADQFATAQIAEVQAFDYAMSAPRLDRFHTWLKRRYGQ